jgi:uncharacterized MAPEG superfamily protein
LEASGEGAMTIADWCVLGAVLLYLLTLAPAKVIGRPRFDNSNPRDPAFYRTAMRARALGAHLNGIETFPFFAFAVLIAEFRTGPQFWIDALAVAFLVLRFTFVYFYLSDKPTLRTLIWNAGFAVNVAIFVSPLYPH